MTTDKEPTGSKPAGAGTDGGSSADKPAAAKTDASAKPNPSAKTGPSAGAKPAGAASGASAGAATGSSAGNTSGKPGGSVPPQGAAKRPVTIDLAAEKVTPKPSAASAKPADDATSASKPSEPASEDKKPEAASAASDDKAPKIEGDDIKADVKAELAKEAAAASKASAPKTVRPVKSGVGVGAVIAASVISSAVVLAGVYGLHLAGLLSTKPNPELTASLAQSEARIAELETQLSDMPASLSGPQEQMAGQIADIEAKIVELSKTAPGALVAVIGRDLKALKASVADLQKATGAGDGAGIEERLAKLEETSAQTAGAAGMNGDEIKGRLDGVEEDAKSLQEALSTTDDTLKTLAESQLAGIQVIESELTEVRERVGKIENRIGDAKAQEVAALAVAVSSLKTSVDAGRSYQSELAAVKAVLPDDMDLSALEAHAASGVTPLPQLVAEFPSVARAMFTKIVKPEETSDVLGNLLASAKAIVAVRGPGDDNASGPEATLRRMERAVQAGDLESAVTAFEQLPEPSKVAGAEWAERASARVSVDRLTSTATGKVLAILSKSDS